ncbi:hypothetical protein BDK51DRAFT_28780 [Blyttiomyces helicus]|uniref:Uncharacterized protein n=1 Tax=Blyttiomyces helicus TaxID=388810 RepID=A0A4P9WDB0_9FUNG|nr:hypothetical protein BDK51DRAFT_28780 [Blyttiomyces helicus]|eukprot:RKO90332.1 hypothetical protein BDK51DRAFT_28780 [Blyttiomyces helicus]
MLVGPDDCRVELEGLNVEVFKGALDLPPELALEDSFAQRLLPAQPDRDVHGGVGDDKVDEFTGKAGSGVEHCRGFGRRSGENGRRAIGRHDVERGSVPIAGGSPLSFAKYLALRSRESNLEIFRRSLVGGRDLDAERKKKGWGILNRSPRMCGRQKENGRGNASRSNSDGEPRQDG